MRLTAVSLIVAIATLADEGVDDRVGRIAPAISMDFEGIVEASRTINLGSPAEGILETVTVERGDLVEEGQVIATLESRIEKSTLAIAGERAEFVGALQKRKARLDHATARLAHEEKLHRMGLLSDELLEEARTEKSLASAGVVEVEESLRLAALDRSRAQTALDLRTITSPVTGIVIDRYLSPGELITRQHQSGIVRLARIDPLHVEVSLPSELFGKVVIGMAARVWIDGFPDRHFDTEVQMVDRAVRADIGRFSTRLRLPNPDNELAPGLKCRVRLLKG